MSAKQSAVELPASPVPTESVVETTPAAASEEASTEDAAEQPIIAAVADVVIIPSKDSTSEKVDVIVVPTEKDDEDVSGNKEESKDKNEEDGKEKDDETKDSDEDSDEEPSYSNPCAVDLKKLGKRVRMHNVFEAPRDQYSYHSDPTWQDEMPLSLRKSAESEPRWRKYALLMRNTTESGILRRHSLVVHSPIIRKHLMRILKDYTGILIEQELLEFKAPFEPLFFHWDDIKAVADGTYQPEPASSSVEAVKIEDNKTVVENDKEEEEKVDPELEKQHMQLLVDMLQPEFEQPWKARERFASTGKIEFDCLWTLFPARTLVVSTDFTREESAFIVRSTEKFFSKRDGNVYFIIRAYGIDYDGFRYGLKMNPLAIPQYNGYRSPVELTVSPFEHCSNKEEVMARLLKRGRQFTEMTKMTYINYDGPAVESADNCYEKPKTYTVTGRVIVDTEAYVRFNPGHDIPLYPLDFLNSGKDPRQSSNQDGYTLPGASNYYPEDSERVQEAAIADLRAPSKTTTSGRRRKQALPELSEEQLLICSSTVRGYSLVVKKWLQFSIERFSPLVWNDRAFGALSMPNNQKEVLLSFAKSQGRALAALLAKDQDPAKETEEDIENEKKFESFDDVIAGKGKGLVVLLEGPPGVGKTLTVESIAEKMRVPLYSIGSGELGSYASQLEINLEKVLDMARMWNAVVLLDEADIFLEKRSTQLDRNQMVSTFLRLLEYFEGTIFLTTNRIEAIDPAFESRIHLWLPYVPLEKSHRVDIWKTNLVGVKLGLSEELAVVHKGETPEIVERLAERQFNGREIKNVVKMAALMASGRDEVLSTSHLEAILTLWTPRLAKRDAPAKEVVSEDEFQKV